MPYMVTFTINIPSMLAYMPYMDPMGWLIMVNNHWLVVSNHGICYFPFHL